MLKKKKIKSSFLKAKTFNNWLDFYFYFFVGWQSLKRKVFIKGHLSCWIPATGIYTTKVQTLSSIFFFLIQKIQIQVINVHGKNMHSLTLSLFEVWPHPKPVASTSILLLFQVVHPLYFHVLIEKGPLLIVIVKPKIFVSFLLVKRKYLPFLIGP